MVAGNSPGTKLDGEIHRKHFGDPDLPGRSLQEGSLAARSDAAQHRLCGGERSGAAAGVAAASAAAALGAAQVGSDEGADLRSSVTLVNGWSVQGKNAGNIRKPWLEAPTMFLGFLRV